MSKQRTTERIRWICTLNELPDEGVTVLMHGDFDGDPVWPGYLDEADEMTSGSDIWRTVEGTLIRGVTHWAEWPSGPVVSAEVGK